MEILGNFLKGALLVLSVVAGVCGIIWLFCSVVIKAIYPQLTIEQAIWAVPAGFFVLIFIGAFFKAIRDY